MIVGLLLSVSAALAVSVRLDTAGQAAFHTTPRNLALAEAGVNQAIAQFRDIFIDGNIPSGSSTSHTGNYALQSVSLGSEPINYQLDQPLTNPTNKQLPLGVPFGGLNVLQYNYAVTSGAPNLTNPAAQLRSQFQVNNIPTFQFLAYYNGQLEITPAEDMTLHGRIHTNANLYLNDSGNTVTIADLPPYMTTVQVSAVGSIYRKRSDDGSCSGTVTISKLQDTASPLCTSGGTVSCLDPQDLACQTGGAAVSTSTLNTWQGAMRSGVPNIGLPPGYSTARGAAQGYWANADIRIVLDLNSANDYGQKATSGGSTISLHSIVVQNADGSTDATRTTLLRSFMHSNPGSISYNDVPVTSARWLDPLHELPRRRRRTSVRRTRRPAPPAMPSPSRQHALQPGVPGQQLRLSSNRQERRLEQPQLELDLGNLQRPGSARPKHSRCEYGARRLSPWRVLQQPRKQVRSTCSTWTSKTCSPGTAPRLRATSSSIRPRAATAAP